MRPGRFAALLLVWAMGIGCASQRPAVAPGTAGAQTDAGAAAEIARKDAFREEAPPELEVETHFVAPLPIERRLTSGARVWVFERHDLPLVSVLLTVRAGIDSEPRGKAGLAGLTARMMTEGTRTRTAMQIAEELEDLAVHLGASTGAESTMVGMSSLTETLAQGLDVFADVTLHPAFRTADLERVRKQALTELEQKKGLPRALAADAMAEKLYGPKHPWGQPSGGTPEILKRLSPRDFVEFHRRAFVPSDALFVVVGDVSADQAVALLEPRFAEWKGVHRPRPPLPPTPRLESRAVTWIDRPGSQSQVWLGGPLFAASHPDALSARLANVVLGGMFSSRLNEALREDKGFAYNYFSGVSLLRERGTWIASGAVEAPHTEEAVAEVLRQIERFAKDGPTDVELTRAKERYVGSLPGMFETNDAVAGALATLYIHGLPVDYFRTLPARLERISRADVQRVAAAHLLPAKWPMVIVGPRPPAPKP